jgi:hypothetical protein
MKSLQTLILSTLFLAQCIQAVNFTAQVEQNTVQDIFKRIEDQEKASTKIMHEATCEAEINRLHHQLNQTKDPAYKNLIQTQINLVQEVQSTNMNDSKARRALEQKYAPMINTRIKAEFKTDEDTMQTKIYHEAEPLLTQAKETSESLLNTIIINAKKYSVHGTFTVLFAGLIWAIYSSSQNNSRDSR